MWAKPNAAWSRQQHIYLHQNSTCSHTPVGTIAHLAKVCGAMGPSPILHILLTFTFVVRKQWGSALPTAKKNMPQLRSGTLYFLPPTHEVVLNPKPMGLLALPTHGHNLYTHCIECHPYKHIQNLWNGFSAMATYTRRSCVSFWVCKVST